MKELKPSRDSWEFRSISLSFLTEEEREKVVDFERICINRLVAEKQMLGRDLTKEESKSVVKSVYLDVPGSREARKKLYRIEDQLESSGTDY